MAVTPHLTRFTCHDVTLHGDVRRPCGVTLAFTERTGGCSQAPYASLNLGSNCGDDPAAVAQNRGRVLTALGVGDLAERLVNPLQVHGTRVVTVSDGSEAAVTLAQKTAGEGADAIVCTATDVPVLLCYADCVPVILATEGGFAVIHSGWKGTIGRISALALQTLTRELGCAAEDVICYVGPHIGVDDYEVSAELAERFATEFGPAVVRNGRQLDLGQAVRLTLEQAGVPATQIDDSLPSTASCTERFYSYRAEGGVCGRHGAVAVMAGSRGGEEVSRDI